MSKAFTKESEDGPGELLEVEDLALPPGVKNYMTPAGAARLRAAIEALRGSSKPAAERLAALLRRWEAAEVIDPAGQASDRVLFGATVTVRDEDALERTYQIVGIDEAEPRRGRVSWRSPMARALLNLRVGDVATAQVPGGDEELTVVRIDYRAGDEGG